MFRKIMDFIFGKKPPIFDSKGRIDHKRDKVLDEWKERYKTDETYDWKNHSGMSFKKK